MKKLSAALLCTTLLFAVSGCIPSETSDGPVSSDKPEIQADASQNPRVYMDEIRGTVKDFTGSRLTLCQKSDTYSFDISQAELECKEGLLAGADVCVIYEGQLNTTDTSSVRVLKVADAYHDRAELKEKKTYGQVQGLTENTITLKSKSGKTATYPVTGTEQYYQNGIRPGGWVYLHYRGDFGQGTSENPNILDASQLKVLSVSDIDPLKVPEPTPTPPPQPDTPVPQEKQLRTVIRSVNMNTLQVSPDNSDTVLKLDMSSVPCHFSGGIAAGAHANITYTGEFNGTTLDGITVLGITGEIPEQANKHSISSAVSGEIIGSTANTITIMSPDGISLTFFTDTAQNSSTGGLLTGSSVKLTFDPAESRNTNIYTCIKIEDA